LPTCLARGYDTGTCNRESDKWGRFPIEVVRVEPKIYAAFRRASQFPGHDLHDGNTALVEFSIQPIGTAVEVTVTESGFSRLEAPDSVREDAWKSNTTGWQQELSGLKDRSETTRWTRAQ
jgi:hypothetical protein